MSKKSKKGYKQIIKSQEPSVVQTARSTEFNPDYTDVKRDLKRIGILASTFIVILITLSFILKINFYQEEIMARMFVPGPVDVAPEVMQAMTKPMLPHRSKEYEEIHRRAAEKAQKVFYTDYRVFIGTHSGSGMQETGIRNLVNKDVLCCVNGAFSERWYDVAVSNGKNADRLDVDLGKAVKPDALARCA